MVVKKSIKRKSKKTVKKITLLKKKSVKILSKPKSKRAPEVMASNPMAGVFKAKIEVIGIGGGGGSIVSEIGRSLHKATFVVADTDMRSFKKKPGIKYFLFGQSLTHGLGTGVNPDLGRQAAEQEKERISQFFKDQDIIIFVASLGGGLGSGATEVFAEVAKDHSGVTLGIFTLPFKFEGQNKAKIALKSLRALRKSLNVSITIPNEKIFKVIDANTAITDAFSMVNKNLIESLEGLIDLIYSPGIINIDFADFRSILKERGGLAFLNTAEAQGKNRAEDITKKILHNPLYQNNTFVPEKILFNVSGSNNLNMFEVDKISRAISSLNPKAKIIFGVSKNPKLRNKIKTILLMTGPGSEEKSQVLKPKTKKVELAKVPAPVQTAKKQIKLVKKKKLSPMTEGGGKKVKSKPVKKDVQPSTQDLIIPAPILNQLEESGLKKIKITETPTARKSIRRTALDIKKAEEQREKKQSMQEKEWDIPAFLRFKKQ